MSLSVTPQAHDIVFTFNDSFNCCRSCRTPDDRFYINSHGNLERFQVSKSNGSPAQAFQRAMTHLTATMERKIVKFNGDPDVFSRKVDRIFQSIDSLQEINRSHIERINALMLVYLQEESPKAHVRFSDQIIHSAMMIEEPPPPPEQSRCLIL